MYILVVHTGENVLFSHCLCLSHARHKDSMDTADTGSVDTGMEEPPIDTGDEREPSDTADTGDTGTEPEPTDTGDTADTGDTGTEPEGIECEGEFWVDGEDTEDDLQTVENCKSIKGGLYIFETSLTSLDAFGTLETIEGTLSISGNPSLASINGFNNLTALTKITSEEPYVDLQGHVSISGNPSLMSLDGFNGVQTIEGDLFISDNTSLPNINGFTVLQTVGGDLQISDHPSSDFDGIDQITVPER